MFLPTNTIISCVASYTENTSLIASLEKEKLPESWKKKDMAKRTLKSAPLAKQLIGEAYPVGKRRSGSGATAIEVASPLFAELVKWMTSAGGSDKEINRCLAAALTKCMPFPAVADRPHPWIPNIIPDIFFDTPQKQICIEFHHTNRDEPGVVAGYILKKLDTYMNQLTTLTDRSSS